MRLGKYIKWLEGQDPDLAIPLGLGNPHSWRGYYEQLAFEPVENTTIGRMLEEARSAIGATYTGWKGGEFVMDETSPINIDWQGRWSDGEHLWFWFLELLIQAAKEVS